MIFLHDENKKKKKNIYMNNIYYSSLFIKRINITFLIFELKNKQKQKQILNINTKKKKNEKEYKKLKL